MLAAGCALPIADGPGLQQVPTRSGLPLPPRPMAPKDVPPHPLLGAQSAFHDDHYNSDVSDYPGPLGVNPRQVSRAYGLCGTPRVDSKGRVVTTCANPAFAADPTAPAALLMLLDPDDLSLLAATPFKIGAFDGDDIGGGNYPHVLADDSVINGGSNGRLHHYALVTDPATGQLRWDFSEPIDFSPALTPGDSLFDVMPDFHGRYWFATVGGAGVGGVTVGVHDLDGRLHTLQLPGERTENGLAVGEQGLYLVTDTALYRFDWDAASGAPVQSWREPYASVPKPPEAGLFSEGSGSTPTLLGREYIAITDNDAPRVNLLVYRRGRSVDGDRLVCKLPVFEAGRSANDLSLIGDRRSIVATNWYGAPQPYTLPNGQTLPPFFSDYRGMAGGMTRVDILPQGQGCKQRWHNPDIRTNAVPKLSTATGLIYLHGQRVDTVTEASQPPIDAYYLQAVSMDTGRLEWEVLAGTGPYYSGGGLTTTLGPNGAFYQATAGGLYRIQDAATTPGTCAGQGKGPPHCPVPLQDLREQALRTTDCTQQTLLPSLLSSAQGGPVFCDVAGSLP